MRVAAVGRNPKKIQITRASSVAAPIGGWNARDALGAMGKLDAVSLQNMWPGTSSVIVRSGYTKYCTGISGQVETLAPYSSASSNKLFCAAGTSIYEVVAGAVGAAKVTSLTNARWQDINITTPGGSYLMMVNGADKLRTFDGTNWHKDGDGAPYDVTGVNTAACSNIALFKNRVWLIENASLKSWYLPVNSIGGAAASLDMTSIAQLGGKLVAAATWTLDAGYGMDDHLAFITNKGEVIVWKLDDPTTPTGIVLIGVYQIGSPIGLRCTLKYGGDLLIITQDGLVPMAAALQSSRLDPRVSLTDKIQFAISQSISNYGSSFGWDVTYFPKENQLYLNVPVREGSLQQQYVMNTITKAWCNFTGWEANCFATFNDNLFFGGNGYVGNAWSTNADNGTNINFQMLQSFQYHGGAEQKQVSMIRTNIFTNGSPSLSASVNTDFNIDDTAATASFSPSPSSVWDTAIWDTSLWGGGAISANGWQGVSAVGYCFAPFIKGQTQGVTVEYLSTDMLFMRGGVV